MTKVIEWVKLQDVEQDGALVRRSVEREREREGVKRAIASRAVDIPDWREKGEEVEAVAIRPCGRMLLYVQVVLGENRTRNRKLKGAIASK